MFSEKKKHTLQTYTNLTVHLKLKKIKYGCENHVLNDNRLTCCACIFRCK